MITPNTPKPGQSCSQRRLTWLCSLLFLSTAAPATPVDLPAPPVVRSARGLPPDMSEAVEKQNGSAWQAWRNGLSAEQRAAWYQANGIPDQSQGRRRGTRTLPDPDSGYDWHYNARQAGLKDAEIELLARDKLLIEDISLKQSFEPYTRPRRPLFITSDSALNAFNVLFEDSFRELETRRAPALRQQLENVLTKCRELMAGPRNGYPAAVIKPGWEHTQLVIGPALRLLGTGPEFFDDSVRDEIDRQVGKIRAAEAIELPAWLGPVSSSLLAVDYRAFRPTGFYAGSEALQNYFRAVRWLQVIPFRADRDIELTAIGLLGYATMESYETGAHNFFADYGNLLGRPDDPGLAEAADEFQNFLFGGRSPPPWNLALAEKRRWLLRRFIKSDEWNKLRNTLQLPPAGEEKLHLIQFRVMSAYRMPDSLALAATAPAGRLPDGLVVAALLGSDFARRQLAGTMDAGKLAAGLKAAQDDWHPTDQQEPESRYGRSSMYDRYLELLATLNVPAEPDAPAFMRNEAWAAKSCLTTLSGWAQLRHTFTLQAKESVNYFGMGDVPPGFIEPNPAFFGRLADLVEWTANQLEAGETFTPSATADAEALRADADRIEKMGLHLPSAAASDLDKLPQIEIVFHSQVLRRMEAAMDAAGHKATAGASNAEFQALHRDVIAKLRAMADDYSAGRRQSTAVTSSYRLRWNTLQSLTRRLETLAHKQLRQQAWTPEETIFIRQYGEKLGLIMGYFGNAWLTPRDDAPRWATVASDPSTDTMLAIGTGRPRLIHVLYPWKGMEILCTGSVMSYYEYPAKHRATDAEWKTQLDSPTAPPMPGWITPYLAK